MGLLDEQVIEENEDDKELIDTTNKWFHESETKKSSYEQRWAKNIRLSKGIWEQTELTESRVRGRSKLFFRKIWATTWRLVAAFYQAFFKEPEHGAFVVEGRGPEDVENKAKVLQFMGEYHLDKADAEQSLFLQHIWGFQNISNMGWAGGKLWWDKGPHFKVYPNEQIYPDMSAETEEEMNYIMFRNYMTKQDMKRMGYENIDKADPTGRPVSQLRQARLASQKEPLSAEQEYHYPVPGKANQPETDTAGAIYIVDEWFWRENDGNIYMATVNPNKAVLKKKKKSPFGKWFPSVLGTCLTESNKLIGEGFPEVLEGPQQSYNHLINIRKDNVHLAVNKHKYVNRYGNVDLASLVNSRAGAFTLMDNTDAVRTEDTPDVTQSAYAEAGQDVLMMEEMSGITAPVQGMMKNEKATTAQININEANVKLDLFISIVAHTWVKNFYRKWIYLIQRFETDKNIFRVANRRLIMEAVEKSGGRDIKTLTTKEVRDIDDFDADVRIKVGLSAPAKTQKIQNAMMAIDRAIMSNQSTIALMKTGAIKQNEKVKIFNVAAFMEDVLPELGYKNIEKYMVDVSGPPPQQQGQGTQMDAAAAGGLQPQLTGSV